MTRPAECGADRRRTLRFRLRCRRGLVVAYALVGGQVRGAGWFVRGWFVGGWAAVAELLEVERHLRVGRRRLFVEYALVKWGAAVQVIVDVECRVSVQLGGVGREEHHAISPVDVEGEEGASQDEASADGVGQALLVTASADAGDVVLTVAVRVAEGKKYDGIGNQAVAATGAEGRAGG